MDRLIEALRLLACSADEQQAAFPEFVVVPDEIALVFDDEYRNAEADIAGQPLATRTALAAIKQRLEQLSDDRSRWTLDALRTGAEWRQLRGQAAGVLSQLGAPLQPPALSWLTFVPG
jgi:hypothetical protein